jgi:mono/diheme cytochrome c family protein
MGGTDEPAAPAAKPIDEVAADHLLTWLEKHGHQLAYGIAALLFLVLIIGHFVWHEPWSALLLPLIIFATTRLIRWKPELWTFFLPAAVLVVIMAVGATVQEGLVFCSEPTIGLGLPSEKAIPPEVILHQPSGEKEVQLHRFRYDPTGTEGRAGIPYWIFRVMPRLFAADLNHQGYKYFGFDDDDGAPFYQRRAGDSLDGSFKMPRGAVLVDTGFDVPLFHFKVGLKRVALNCSACHRGKVAFPDGKVELFDGMPNHTANLQAFKRFFSSAIDDERFNADAVIAAIDQALAEDHQEPLTPKERWAYRGIVATMKELGKDKTGKWQDSRPYNGPGRIDPFNAVKFEVLHADDDHTVATLDFPAIWNQRGTMRPWHHYDGNTNNSEARNYGSVIGVGGLAITVHKQTIDAVGDWIDGMKPPDYPFTPPDPAHKAAGKTLYEKHCQGCHGAYDHDANSVTMTGGYMKPHKEIATDEERLKAFTQTVADVLNNFGDRRQLWPAKAFRAAQDGYISGPLDGIWARAPYLHNGSVPTLYHLLKPSARPKVFCRGNPEYDQKRLGFRWEPKDDGCDRPEGRYDTSLTGNHNTGHEVATLSDAEIDDLIAYLKTL